MQTHTFRHKLIVYGDKKYLSTMSNNKQMTKFITSAP